MKKYELLYKINFKIEEHGDIPHQKYSFLIQIRATVAPASNSGSQHNQFNLIKYVIPKNLPKINSKQKSLPFKRRKNKKKSLKTGLFEASASRCSMLCHPETIPKSIFSIDEYYYLFLQKKNVNQRNFWFCVRFKPFVIWSILLLILHKYLYVY